MDLNERALNNPPSDGISAITFGPASNLLLVSSWDTSLRLYDVTANIQRTKIDTPAAVLDCCFGDATHAFSGGLDQTVRSHDLNTNQTVVVGPHDAPVRCVATTTNGAVLSGSWDKTVRLWDPRSRTGASVHQQADKVYTMAVADEKLVVGMAGRHVWIWDLRNMAAPEQRRESSLKYQTRCIRTFPDKQGYVVTSIEGRVSVEYFDPSPESQKRKYAFKCHRQVVDGQDTIYPVNTVAFHPRYGSFATGGCDGYVNVWDGNNKKRLCQFHKYNTSIAALSFNCDGSMLAIASSYTFEEGDKEHPADAIFVRTVNDSEVKPK